MKKQEVQELLDCMPDDIDGEQLMHDLYLKLKIEHAEQAVAEGRVTTHEELVRETDEWFK